MRRRYDPWWEKYMVRSELAIDLFNSHQRDLWFRDDEECLKAERRADAAHEDAFKGFEEDIPF